MEDGQRIAPSVHIEARDRPPRAAHQKEAFRLGSHGVGQFGDLGLHMGADALFPALDRFETLGTKLRADPFPDTAVGQGGEFH